MLAFDTQISLHSSPDATKMIGPVVLRSESRNLVTQDFKETRIVRHVAGNAVGKYMYRIRFALSGTEVVCTPDHQFGVGLNGNLNFVQASEIYPGYFVPSCEVEDLWEEARPMICQMVADKKAVLTHKGGVIIDLHGLSLLSIIELSEALGGTWSDTVVDHGKLELPPTPFGYLLRRGIVLDSTSTGWFDVVEEVDHQEWAPNLDVYTVEVEDSSHIFFASGVAVGDAFIEGK